MSGEYPICTHVGRSHTLSVKLELFSVRDRRNPRSLSDLPKELVRYNVQR